MSNPVTQQVAIPIADVSVGGWTPLPVWQQISPYGGAGVSSSPNPQADTFQVKLSPMAVPEATTPPGQTLTINMRTTGAGAGVLPITVTLLQGSTTIASWLETPGSSFTSYALALSQAQVNSITDYTNLRVQVQ